MLKLLSKTVSIWREVVPVLRTRGFRLLAGLVVAVVALSAVSDVIAGLLRYNGTISEATSNWFRVSKDWSVWETIGYGFFQSAAVLTYLTARKLGSSIHRFLAALFQFLVFDDALQFHERFGYQFGNRFLHDVTLVEPHAAGEVVYAIIAFSIIFFFLFRSYRASTERQRALGLMLVVPLAIVAGGAIGVDFIYQLVPKNELIRGAVATLENCTELFGTGLAMLAAAVQWMAFVKTGPAQPKP